MSKSNFDVNTFYRAELTSLRLCDDWVGMGIDIPVFIQRLAVVMTAVGVKISLINRVISSHFDVKMSARLRCDQSQSPMNLTRNLKWSIVSPATAAEPFERGRSELHRTPQITTNTTDRTDANHRSHRSLGNGTDPSRFCKYCPALPENHSHVPLASLGTH